MWVERQPFGDASGFVRKKSREATLAGLEYAQKRQNHISSQWLRYYKLYEGRNIQDTYEGCFCFDTYWALPRLPHYWTRVSECVDWVYNQLEKHVIKDVPQIG